MIILCEISGSHGDEYKNDSLYSLEVNRRFRGVPHECFNKFFARFLNNPSTDMVTLTESTGSPKLRQLS
jgi:hypothetical protein